MVIPFVFNREVRTKFRNTLSYLYRFIINNTFGVNFNYTNGTILYRKSILKGIRHRIKGFFFQTDILVKSAKKGYLFAQVPYALGIRQKGKTKAFSFNSFLQISKDYLHLIKECYLEKNKNINIFFSEDSVTKMRRNL